MSVIVSQGSVVESPYRGETFVLTTMHSKEAAVAPVFAELLGVNVQVAPGIDTDSLGTFTGDVPRPGNMRETAILKARLGLKALGGSLGLASEGSYGPHPIAPFIGQGCELMAFIDEGRQLVVVEQLVDDSPNFVHTVVAPGEDLGAFLARAAFPTHALVVAPHKPAGSPLVGLRKGVSDINGLLASVDVAAKASTDGLALIQSDMRAHCNPTRMAVIEKLSRRLAERLLRCCPRCQAPGFGRVDVERGLPCEECGSPTELVFAEVFGCGACSYRELRSRSDGRRFAEARWCPVCNP